MATIDTVPGDDAGDLVQTEPPMVEDSMDSGGAAATRRGMLSYKPVGALLAGLSVLRYMAAASGPQPLWRIARDLGINPSTCLNILRTLAHENYLIFDPQSKLYSMGIGVLELLGGALVHGGEMRAIRALTDLISKTEGVTITLWRRVPPNRIMLVLESLPACSVRITTKVGQRLPILFGAAGQLMGAYSNLSETELSGLFQQSGLTDRLEFREFMDEVSVVRDRGWSADKCCFTVGVTSVAVPVLNEAGEAVFALAATMFSEEYSLERAAYLAAELGRPAALLASVLPYV